MTTSAPRTMTAERWRAVDHVLQGALTCTRDQRDTFVAQACGDDASLRNEVSSLLAVHDTAPVDFLERPAFEEHGMPSTVPVAAPTPPPAATPLPARTVAARFVVYAAAAGIAAGIVTGWRLAHSPAVARWSRAIAAARQQASATGADNANATSNSGASGAGSLVVVDRSGRVLRDITANRPWTPRFSPDGRRIAYGAFGEGRGTSDIWITDLDAGTTRRLTDNDADSNNPQWSPDGTTLAYSVNAPGGKDIAEQRVDGGDAHVVASRPGTQVPTDWLHNGSALLVSEDGGAGHFDILVQPANGSPARPYAATGARKTAGRISPHTHWVAYTSDESGREEVYVDSYPNPRDRVMVSHDGGADPVWRGDGRELYYWRGDALIALPIDGSIGGRPPTLGPERVLFQYPYEHTINTMYDVSPDGQRIAIVRRR
jgi:dipeptidyl aminopeptidase/acylaminoacyl peptidase